jgi:type II secretory pathway pseudopilin PulG
MIKKAGFTIMELLIVIAVFFIMIGVLTPFVKMARARAVKMQCANNLREISLGLHAFAADHNDVFPAKLSDLYPNYVADEKTFDCPASKTEGTSKNPNYSYASNLRESSDPKEAIIADLDGNHKKSGKNVLRVGGSVGWVR